MGYSGLGMSDEDNTRRLENLESHVIRGVAAMSSAAAKIEAMDKRSTERHDAIVTRLNDHTERVKSLEISRGKARGVLAVGGAVLTWLGAERALKLLHSLGVGDISS